MMWSLMVVAVTAAGTADASQTFIDRFESLDACRTFYQEAYEDLPVRVLHAVCYDQTRYSFITDAPSVTPARSGPTS